MPFIRFGPLVLVFLAVLCGAQDQRPNRFGDAVQTFKGLAKFNGPDGDRPFVGLVQGTDGNFYGTTYQGGVSTNCNLRGGCGVVFKISRRHNLTTLHNFCDQPACTDGANPLGGLVLGADGNFYGTTIGGGASGVGTVFKITPRGQLTTLYSFCALDPYCSDGASPIAGLTQSADGNFYGTTQAGGVGGGTVFKITAEGVLTTLHSFANQGDGVQPMGVLVQATDGNFYGTTSNGGVGSNCSNSSNNYCGTVFKITPRGKLTTLYAFCRQTNCSDGASPWAGLIQATDGNFYGTTSEGGTLNLGTVFRITPAGDVTTLHRFCSHGNCPDGAEPLAALVQASDGNLYGTTFGGGDNQAGTVFKITPGGKLTTLHSFDFADGTNPGAALVQNSDGILYGTTETGGNLNCDPPYGCGTVFSLSVALAPEQRAGYR